MGESVRQRFDIQGAVQGVGFRPTVYRLACELGLSGWIANTANGVRIEVEGTGDSVAAFRSRLENHPPPAAVIRGFDATTVAPSGNDGLFEIRISDAAPTATAAILPDLATCAQCREEVFDSDNRRHFYAFTNCTNCGPRYSIIESLPYDRSRTTMERFGMCQQCQAEYDNPSDRRFHAQPNACPECGPTVTLWDPDGRPLAVYDEALRQAIEAIKKGKIVGMKGLGGFQLLVDAGNTEAVTRLRERKGRPHKAFAVMTADMAMARRQCMLTDAEESMLASPQAPIVLAARRSGAEVSAMVAPESPNLGIMLPYSPLHHLLMSELRRPVVATSGNLSDEPICIDNVEAVERLRPLVDLFLLHNRPIARQVDDSVVRVVAERPMIYRRARGYAPLPVCSLATDQTILAVGGQLKNTVAFAVGGRVIASQHVGDLESEEGAIAFERTIAQLLGLYGLTPEYVACDMHPDYYSTLWAQRSRHEVIPVQHHHAHVAAVMAEHGLDGPVLGVAFDGTGYGPDGTVWGGEFLVCEQHKYDRVGQLRRFPLPGGDKVAREPRRAALGLLYELLGGEGFERDDIPSVAAFDDKERTLLASMLAAGVNSVRTSSSGRLFDAVASLLDLKQISTYEAQAAMLLEATAQENEADDAYRFDLMEEDGALVLDWAPVVRAILDNISHDIDKAVIAARFHSAMAAAVVGVARSVGIEDVVLSGGCFQNRLLTERAIDGLRQAGFRPHWALELPPGDGALSVGQLVVAAAQLRRR